MKDNMTTATLQKSTVLRLRHVHVEILGIDKKINKLLDDMGVVKV